MKEQPIIFTGDSIRRILERRKTQTRRVCRDQTPKKYWWGDNLPMIPDGKEKYTGWVKDIPKVAIGIPTKCPYGIPGDRLWVRERFRVDKPFTGDLDHDLTTHRITYYADDHPKYRDQDKWKPSIFMPRKASRITLEVVSVRVERIQLISNADILAEGVTPVEIDPIDPPDPWDDFHQAYRLPFEKLWNSINAKRGYGWEQDPWCWVVEFKPLGESK